MGEVESLDPVPEGDSVVRIAVHAIYKATQKPFQGSWCINRKSSFSIEVNDTSVSRPLGATWTSDFHVMLSYPPPHSSSPQSVIVSTDGDFETPKLDIPQQSKKASNQNNENASSPSNVANSAEQTEQNTSHPSTESRVVPATTPEPSKTFERISSPAVRHCGTGSQ